MLACMVHFLEGIIKTSSDTLTTADIIESYSSCSFESSNDGTDALRGLMKAPGVECHRTILPFPNNAA